MTRFEDRDYLTVEEYRIKIGFASSQNIYRAIRQGRLESIKVGGMVLIPSDAIIVDRRVKHGRYVGLRKLLNADIASVHELPNLDDRLKGRSIPTGRTNEKLDTD